jgi:hypothetical protein
MKCELLETTDDGQDLAVTFTLEEGKVTARAEPGSEEIISNLENQTIFVGGRNIKFKDDPTGWFDGLWGFQSVTTDRLCALTWFKRHQRRGRIRKGRVLRVRLILTTNP